MVRHNKEGSVDIVQQSACLVIRPVPVSSLVAC